MTAATFPDAIIDFIGNGCVRIEQSTGCGETTLVDLHPVQVQFIAERMGLLKGGPDLQSQVIALARQIRWLAQSIEGIREQVPADMIERCGDAFAFFAWLQMLESATALLLEDVPSLDGPAAVPRDSTELPAQTDTPAQLQMTPS